MVNLFSYLFVLIVYSKIHTLVSLGLALIAVLGMFRPGPLEMSSSQ